MSQASNKVKWCLNKAKKELDKNDEKLIAGCVGRAILKKEYIKLIKDAGFEIKNYSEDKEISKRQYNGLPVESLKLTAYKR